MQYSENIQVERLCLNVLCLFMIDFKSGIEKILQL